ncbi:MAG: FtsW/RodA/SpoVE family cell cycle protein, partial [Thermoleophilaceae bacterium]|nr:FtsW/RodA/SpoVE family cell cycle protein [Thermoleophilaceae bacterium]
MQASPYGTSVKAFRDGVGPRFVRMDPLLVLAILGLLACSLYTIASATKGDIDGDPNFYLFRQAAYAGVGLIFMFILSRVDYSRFREWRAGLYVGMLAAIMLVFALGTAVCGSRRALDLGFFSLQTSELGKVLLILTLSAFAVDRIRRLGDRETTSRLVLLALVPAMLVVAQPDLGSGL